MMNKKQNIAFSILRLFESHGFQSFIVGGSVRDRVMHRMPHDYDIATNATPDEIIEVAENHNIKWIPTGIAHGTISFILDNDIEIQITTFRIDENHDGRHADVKWTQDLNVDLSRRDFTINAMAMDLRGNIFDPFRGQADIQRKIIRTVGHPMDRFTEDKLRALRAIRFATTLDFRVDYLTWKAIKQTNISNISKERIRDEFIKIMEHPNRVHGFKMLDESGLLKQIIPEFEDMKYLRAGAKEHHPEKDVFIHTIAALSHLKKDASLQFILATILHDIGKPPTWNEFNFHGHDEVGAKLSEDILRRLKFPLEIIENVKWLVANHMRIHLFNEMRTAKKIRLLEMPLFDELVDLLRADIMVRTDIGILDDIQKFKSEQYHKARPKMNLINGHDVINFGVKPGPQIADILTSVEDLILEGRITTRDDALKHVEEVIEMNGMCGC